MAAVSTRFLRPTTILAGVAVTGGSYAITHNDQAGSKSTTRIFGRGPAMISLPLESSEQINHNTKLLRFKFPNEADVSGLSLTSSVLTASWPKGSWIPVARPYTPVSSLEEPGKLELLVKQYSNGKQSTHLHSLQPGDTLLFAASLRAHQWEPNSAPHVTLIAGGSGITPIYQLARGILMNPDDKTKVTLVYTANTEQDLLLKKEFDTFEEEFPSRFEAVYAVSQPAERSAVRQGRVTKALLEEAIPARLCKDGRVYICGPPAMEAALKGDKKTIGILEEVGFNHGQVHSF